MDSLKKCAVGGCCRPEADGPLTARAVLLECAENGSGQPKESPDTSSCHDDLKTLGATKLVGGGVYLETGDQIRNEDEQIKMLQAEIKMLRQAIGRLSTVDINLARTVASRRPRISSISEQFGSDAGLFYSREIDDEEGEDVALLRSENQRLREDNEHLRSELESLKDLTATNSTTIKNLSTDELMALYEEIGDKLWSSGKQVRLQRKGGDEMVDNKNTILCKLQLQLVRASSNIREVSKLFDVAEMGLVMRTPLPTPSPCQAGPGGDAQEDESDRCCNRARSTLLEARQVDTFVNGAVAK